VKDRLTNTLMDLYWCMMYAFQTNKTTGKFRFVRRSIDPSFSRIHIIPTIDASP
jgi:hypothetical protein